MLAAWTKPLLRRQVSVTLFETSCRRRQYTNSACTFPLARKGLRLDGTRYSLLKGFHCTVFLCVHVRACMCACVCMHACVCFLFFLLSCSVALYSWHSLLFFSAWIQFVTRVDIVLTLRLLIGKLCM